jgi:hypothetical protein
MGRTPLHPPRHRTRPDPRQAYGDNAPYDLVVDHQGHFLRIQVKCTLQRREKNSYRCCLDHNGIPYTPAQIDFFAVYVIPADTFYILPLAATHSQPDILLIANVFPNHAILPNVKLRAGRADPTPRKEAISALREIVEKRINVEKLFADPKPVETLIAYSGGSVRQLIRLLREAVLSSQARRIEVRPWQRPGTILAEPCQRPGQRETYRPRPTHSAT